MRHRPLTPPAHGLYLPEFEHDACGVGAICNLKGETSHGIIEKALEILVNLTHRGASGCDAKTGDGAGILMQVPHALMKVRCDELSINLPGAQEYGVGLVFLPPDEKQRALVKQWVREVVLAEGQEFLGFRDMHTNNEVIGESARSVEPYIEMVFIGRGKGMVEQADFERKLYVIRKVIERRVRDSEVPERQYFYIPSLSSRTIVYKGLLLADQVGPFYPDLKDPLAETAMALVHQRYSTNTFPTWDLAQPFRFLCHNGEINTVRGNANWITARQYLFESPAFGEDIKKLYPIVAPRGSDSAVLDNALEVLYHSGRSLPHAVMMLIPEAWQNHQTMSDEKRAFYEYHSCLMEPWDGPASIPFCDGEVMGATLDRNGLRPSRYTVTKDGFVVMGSEAGVLEIDPENVESKGRLEPGKMFLVNTAEGRIVDDDEIKDQMASRKPYRKWLKEHLVDSEHLPKAKADVPGTDYGTLLARQQTFGYTLEDQKILLAPMGRDGKEPLGSMGSDTPLAVLSDRPQLLYSYFRQLFAQVTNPPLDAIREELVTSLRTNIGSGRNMFEETPEHCNQLRLETPVITNEELARIQALDSNGLHAATFPILYPVAEGGAGLKAALATLFAAVSKAVDAGKTIVVLSDRGTDATHAPIPALLAVAGLHHHLIREGKRTRCGIVLESGEPREVHHFCVLSGFGVGAVNPYLAYETLDELILRDMIVGQDLKTVIKHFNKAISKGMLKIMSKMGISTLHSYRGPQVFECIGIANSVIDEYFTWTPSRIGGIDLDGIAEETRLRHVRAYPPAHIPRKLDLDVGGLYQWRRNGEHHLFNPLTVSKLQMACRTNEPKIFAEYSEMVNNQSRKLCTLRSLLDFNVDESQSIDLAEVEPWESIAKRFKSGAMSYGSISAEAHETLAIAMNRIGGRSNSGEGGEDERRFTKDPNGDDRCSAIKQCASGRFGVTAHYLANARELQIKMAQGAKPGEGGQLPGKKVWPWIAKVRHSTPYVGLISPPPHHDIYSIEDLAQLIHDLKNANPNARINVKLVAEVGVGTVAAGVSKGKADVVLISGWDGGTGASPMNSLKHAGLPWELGIAETHQTLVQNDLRSRIVVECDGQLKTGRDVAVACLLGAEEFGFATAPLVVMGCIMMRVCHLDTCPVGVATQNPDLRKKFTGKPEHVVNFLRFIAEDLRVIMAKLGFRTINEMVGHVEKLKMKDAIDFWKAKGLDYSKILAAPNAPAEVGRHCSISQDHGLKDALDNKLIEKAHDALEHRKKVRWTQPIRNINRTVGTMLSWHVTKRYGAAGLPDGSITIDCVGSAGQSFGAFTTRGLAFHIEGDANDYIGKGLSGALISVRPPRNVSFEASENVIIGNVALYGATTGELYVNGKAGERFCVRNSGARAVVEGVGDHGCEYMTGGHVVVIGPTGRNFAAGMSGGIAFVLDEDGEFARTRCNMEMVGFEPITDVDVAEIRELLTNHHSYTGSARAKALLDDWDASLKKFLKVMPSDYKKALERLAEEEAAEQEEIPAKA